MPITTTNPTTVPPTPAVVCDQIWVERLIIDGSQLDGAPVKAAIAVRPYATTAEGATVYAPASARRVYQLPDLYALAATHPAIANALQAVLEAVQQIVADADAQQQQQPDPQPEQPQE